MAGAGPKKRLEENKRRLLILKILVGLGFLCQCGSLWLQGITTWRLIGFAGTVLATGGSYLGIATLASPVYDENGVLIDGGADLDRVSKVCIPCLVDFLDMGHHISLPIVFHRAACAVTYMTFCTSQHSPR
jgi:hypothetical protein